MAAGRRDAELYRAVLAAGALHALVLGFVASAPERGPALRRVHWQTESSVEVTVESSPSAGSGKEPRGAALASADVARASRQPGSRTSTLGGEPANAAPAASEPTMAESAATEPARSGAHDDKTKAGPSLPLDKLGIGSSGVLWVEPRRPAPKPAAVAARKVERSLAEGLAAHDQKLGLGSEGPVVSALERATYSSDVPFNGNALFLARIDSHGKLSGLDVLEVNGAHGGWTRIAASARKALGGRKLRLPQGARGVELHIRVTSRETLPSGADPGLEVRALGLPLKKGKGKRSAKISILEPRASVKMADVPQPGNKSIRMPTPDVGVGLLGVAGDPADIGANPRRMVHAKLEKQTVL